MGGGRQVSRRVNFQALAGDAGDIATFREDNHVSVSGYVSTRGGGFCSFCALFCYFFPKSRSYRRFYFDRQFPLNMRGGYAIIYV